MDNNIGCYLITEFGVLERALLSEELLVGLATSLRTKEIEEVHFKDESFLVEGLYIPAKGTKYSLMVLPNMID